MNKIITKNTVRKRVKTVYIYRDSKLPYNGWIQSCFNCYIFTERNILFKTSYDDYNKTLYEFNVFLCPLCQRDLLKKKNKENILLNIKFQQKCNRYIQRNYYI
jgi:hypothetical protein